MPSCSRTPARYFAATNSFPGGLVVLMRIRFCNQPTASTSIWERLEDEAGAACAAVAWLGAWPRACAGECARDCAEIGAAEVKVSTSRMTTRRNVRAILLVSR